MLFLSFQSWKLTAADRSGLLDDAMNLARAGFLGYDVALEMTSYLNREDNFVPWQSTYASLTYISSMLTYDTDFGLWRVRSDKLHCDWNSLGIEQLP